MLGLSALVSGRLATDVAGAAAVMNPAVASAAEGAGRGGRAGSSGVDLAAGVDAPVRSCDCLPYRVSRRQAGGLGACIRKGGLCMLRRTGLSGCLMLMSVMFAMAAAPCVFATGGAAADPQLMPVRFTLFVTDDGWMNLRPQRDHPAAEVSCAPSCAADHGGADAKARRLTAREPR